MTIKEIHEFQVSDRIETPDETPKLLLENKRLRKKVEVLGKVLEAQYCIEDNFLVLVTEGIPFEEALYIYYFSNDLQLMDSLELSAMYAEGMLRNVSVVNSDEIKFSFFDNNEQWNLKILSSPRYAIFSNKYPAKRKLSVFHKAWLSLKKS